MSFSLLTPFKKCPMFLNSIPLPVIIWLCYYSHHQLFPSFKKTMKPTTTGDGLVFIKVLVFKPGNLSLIPRTHVEGEN